VTVGKFPGGTVTSAFKEAFSILRYTSAGRTTYPEILGPGLYLTLDFAHTILTGTGSLLDSFLKPVNWVLSTVHSDNLIVLSQYEANELLHEIKSSTNTRLHIYTPRLTKPMQSFRRLDFYNIGGSDAYQPNEESTRFLELFAGSLYFTCFKEYKDFRYFLGLVTDCLEDILDDDMSNEGFVNATARQKLRWPVNSPFKENPLPFLSAWVHIRTKGHGHQQTDVGTIIDSQIMTSDRF
jgi:hypothetical protein